MRSLLLFFAACSSRSSNDCPPGKHCMSLRFCPSEEVENLDQELVCGSPGFHRYCCSPQKRELPEKPKEELFDENPKEWWKHKCSKDSDCPVTQLPPTLEGTLPNVEIYRCPSESEWCGGDWGNPSDKQACLEERTCQLESGPLCAHPEARTLLECEIKESDKVYTVDKNGDIPCYQDSDCPPTVPPSWEWNEQTKMEYEVTSITEMSISVPYCAVYDYDYNYDQQRENMTDLPNASSCAVRPEPFCDHAYGRSHPECQRCNVLSPLPEPQCLAYGLMDEFIDECCIDLFNTTVVEELKNSDIDNDYLYDIDLREDIMKNFTINDCKLSALHLPPNAPQRTFFDHSLYCWVPTHFASEANPLSFLTSATGIGSLIPQSLARSTPSCPPTSFCKRPSLARPGKIICCLLIRAPWGRGRIAICPNSCD